MINCLLISSLLIMDWFLITLQGIFSVRQPNPDIYLVVRVDKILQGNIATCTEPYLKTGDIMKVRYNL